MNLVTFADGNPKIVGNEVFIGTNIVVAKDIRIADGCKLSACSFVNKNFKTPNMLIGGVPAKELKACSPWTDECRADVEECERLKNAMGLNI